MKVLIPFLVIAIAFIAVTFAIAVTTLVKVNQGFDKIPTLGSLTSIRTTTGVTTTANPTTTNQPATNETLATYIRIDDVMKHLYDLQGIADAANGTRTTHTLGFNRTLDYIIDTLTANTNYNINTTFFPVRQFILTRNPVFISSINGTTTNHTYSNNFSIAEFYHAQYSTSIAFPDYVELTVIPNVGCTDADWSTTALSPAGRVALVKRGDCNFADKATLALQYNVTALLIYNDGTASDRVAPILISLGTNNTLPALFLSYTLGQQLADAVENNDTSVSVLINIDVQDDLPVPVGNICADTPTGDPTQTIVIGSHSDSVPAGPGINDNGSGSAANLGLAIALARLFQTSTYAKYKYRVRFCWWGAEEIGLLGSDYHVKQAKVSGEVGERLSDYLINLNYDMLGSQNFMFGIYDGKTARNDTPPQALPGSNKITDLYISWFEDQKLPWNYTDFSGRSDYGPFLAEGVVCGGLFSGADGTKSQYERDYYDSLLGQGMGGIAGAIHDPCYHQACDSVQNINQFAYDKMVRAAGYVLEYLGRQDDLKTWLYPNGTVTRRVAHTRSQEYNSINEYFQLPYF